MATHTSVKAKSGTNIHVERAARSDPAMDNVTLSTALQEKYSTSSIGSLHCQIFVTSQGPGKTVSGNLRVPENLMLDCRGITSAGQKVDLQRLCSDVKELDLAQNNIGSWDEVWTILEEIPKLEFLNLTKNPLPALSGDEVDRRYPNLKKLVLNFTNLTWDTITNLLTALPNLEELYLSGNHYDSVTLDIPAYESLRLLQLTDNKLNDWKGVLKLDKLFPQLNNLILAHNDITSCGSAEENCSRFPNLQVLNMNNTSISEWNELDKLAAIRSVSDVRLASIPLVESYEAVKRRQMVVAYFPHAKRLNGSVVAADERDTAERVFLRHFQHETNKPNRYAELQTKHGELDPLAAVILQPADTVAMTVMCEDREALFDVPTKQTIGQLKTSLRKFVGCKKFRLYHDDQFQGPTEIKTTNRFVWALNFRDGEFLICDKIEETSPTSSPRKSQSSPIKTASTGPRSHSSVGQGNGTNIENMPPSPSKEPPLKKR